jgi:hypothetical protein
MNEPSERAQALPGESCSPIKPAAERPIENKELPASPSAQDRHSRKCRICRHPEREAIEQEYRDWFNPTQIARHYKIPERPLYRHFHAVGLVSSRRENLRMILDRIIERGPQNRVSGNTIIKAIRAQCCLTDGNKWVEPPTHVIFSKDSQPAGEPTQSPVGRSLAPDANNRREPPKESEESFVGRGLGLDIKTGAKRHTNAQNHPQQVFPSPRRQFQAKF